MTLDPHVAWLPKGHGVRAEAQKARRLKVEERPRVRRKLLPVERYLHRHLALTQRRRLTNDPLLFFRPLSRHHHCLLPLCPKPHLREREREREKERERERERERV